jgi:hypothetical protein
MAPLSSANANGAVRARIPAAVAMWRQPMAAAKYPDAHNRLTLYPCGSCKVKDPGAHPPST